MWHRQLKGGKSSFSKRKGHITLICPFLLVCVINDNCYNMLYYSDDNCFAQPYAVHGKLRRYDVRKWNGV